MQIKVDLDDGFYHESIPVTRTSNTQANRFYRFQLKSNQFLQ